jgi:hypothetical protein
MAALVRRYTKETEDFHRKFTLPREDWIRRVSTKWSGGYRWFRSPNITPIEYYRRPSVQVTKPTKRAG